MDKMPIDLFCDISKLQSLYYEIEKNNKELLKAIEEQIKYIKENYCIKGE